MRILDRYIIKSILGIFFTCILTFALLYIVIDVLSNLEDILKQKAGMIVFLQYYLSYLPIIFVQVVPFTGLLATLYTFGKLNRDNEVIAMRASGLSIFQITKTILIFAFVLSIFIFWINDRIVPRAQVLNQKYRTQLLSGKQGMQDKSKEVITNLSMYGLRNRLFFVNKFSLYDNTMEGITILEHDEHQNIVRKIVANKGIYKDGIWTFYNNITYEFDANGQIKNEPQYLEEEIMAISETPREFMEQRQSPDVMTSAQLDDYIWKLSKSGAVGVVKNLKVDLYQRFTSPFTVLIIILLGIPFSLMMRKRATGMSSLGISIMVGFLYYVFGAVSIALGKAGILPPFLAVSLSHIIALSFSFYFLSRMA